MGSTILFWIGLICLVLAPFTGITFMAALAFIGAALVLDIVGPWFH